MARKKESLDKASEEKAARQVVSEKKEEAVPKPGGKEGSQEAGTRSEVTQVQTDAQENKE